VLELGAEEEGGQALSRRM